MLVYGMIVLRFDTLYGKNTVCDMVYVGGIVYICWYDIWDKHRMWHGMSAV